MRFAVLGFAVLLGACGIFDEEEERLEGVRIPVREAFDARVPATPLPPPPEENEQPAE